MLYLDWLMMLKLYLWNWNKNYPIGGVYLMKRFHRSTHLKPAIAVLDCYVTSAYNQRQIPYRFFANFYYWTNNCWVHKDWFCFHILKCVLEYLSFAMSTHFKKILAVNCHQFSAPVTIWQWQLLLKTNLGIFLSFSFKINDMLTLKGATASLTLFL